ncbi:hypothetical protein GU926_12980 [Nibribacter ruber]|uniref:Copper chaperone n=1 Tax=Nibribacter ruber TaxID=2698458 RepID=A0A6P1NWR1_9BACT|nr:hypothetical protein [Nibribacter ruber]QHL88296.1 hypothetical protein GU926_12980 [Nibribacter ruber]
MRTVLVFKTSVRTSHGVQQVAPLLNQLLDATERWNFDLQDCDHILRVEAKAVTPSVIIDKMQQAGFLCAELED